MALIEFHRQMLGDRVRNQAFHDALKKVIRPGMTLTDIGAGTGVLSFFARKLGAKACYLYEHGEILQIAKKIAKENGIDGCHFLARHSSEEKKPVRTDIVVSETLGNFALEEHLIENMEDAKRFLKPGGILIPGTLEQYVAPVTSDRIYKELALWDRVGFGIDFASAREITFQNIYVRTIHPDELFADAIRRWDVINFSQTNKSICQASEIWMCDRDVTFFGFALWWKTELVPGVMLSSAPGDPPTHWEQIFMPVPQPMEMKKGESVQWSIHSDSRRSIGLNVTWKVAQKNAAGQMIGVQEMDMRRGYVA